MTRIRPAVGSRASATLQLFILLYDRFVGLPRNVKQAVLLVLDLVSIPCALLIGAALHFGSFPVDAGTRELITCAVTMVISAVVFLRLGLYRAIVRFMGHEAIAAIVKGVTLSALTLSLLMLLLKPVLPASMPFLYWCLMLVFVGGSRFALRSYYHHLNKKQSQRVAIYGAGSAGRQLLTALHHGERYRPVLFVDDNPALHGSVINGVLVEGRSALPELL